MYLSRKKEIRNPLEGVESETILQGTCYSCKTHLEVPYYKCQPPKTLTFKERMTLPSSIETDNYSCECPKCGAKAYLVPPNYRIQPLENVPLNLKGNK